VCCLAVAAACHGGEFLRAEVTQVSFASFNCHEKQAARSTALYVAMSTAVLRCVTAVLAAVLAAEYSPLEATRMLACNGACWGRTVQDVGMQWCMLGCMQWCMLGPHSAGA